MAKYKISTADTVEKVSDDSARGFDTWAEAHEQLLFRINRDLNRLDDKVLACANRYKKALKLKPYGVEK